MNIRSGNNPGMLACSGFPAGARSPGMDIRSTFGDTDHRQPRAVPARCAGTVASTASSTAPAYSARSGSTGPCRPRRAGAGRLAWRLRPPGPGITSLSGPGRHRPSGPASCLTMPALLGQYDLNLNDADQALASCPPRQAGLGRIGAGCLSPRAGSSRAAGPATRRARTRWRASHVVRRQGQWLR